MLQDKVLPKILPKPIHHKLDARRKFRIIYSYTRIFNQPDTEMAEQRSNIRRHGCFLEKAETRTIGEEDRSRWNRFS